MKPLFWVGDSKEVLLAFPREVQRAMGRGLMLAQHGGKDLHAKPLKGFGGAGVLELLDDHEGDTYRVVYTVRLADAVYVLHTFQKKARRGIATPKQEIDVIRRRLRAAEEHHAANREAQRRSRP